ncbi:hypothetical protein ACIGEZ_04995 [Streptomyces sp. NPDC085481]|uniref:hypothetical protein n=1 Tax=Streptomyces sp. NPDC085481 TaxID=3365727 RepID=UPI0037D9592B
MRRGLVHALAWSLATGAAVTLSWWGVHTVLAGTVYDPPRALPLPASAGSDTDPLASSTHGTRSPSATPSAVPGTTTPPARPTTARPTPRPATPKSAASSPPGSGSVKSYGTDGGRVVFDLGPTSAELVSATPGSGWQMQVWKQPSWIRVTFTRDSREISVFCVWHDTAPRVEIEER